MFHINQLISRSIRSTKVVNSLLSRSIRNKFDHKSGNGVSSSKFNLINWSDRIKMYGTIATDDKTITRTKNSWEEVSIEVPWGFVQGKWWGNRNQQPILALHGWHDNCGSFDRLCPLLPPEIPVLCIDLPGHGRSSHYPKGMQYYLYWDGICLIRRIIRQFGWKRVTLMGHSIGGALTFMYSATFPTEVEKLINIDSAGPYVPSIDRQVGATAYAIDKYLDYELLPEERVNTHKELVKLALHAYEGSVDETSVEILMQRGLKQASQHPNKDAYHISRDLRLKVSHLGMFTAEQTLGYAKRIRCKTLNIRGDPGMKFEYPKMYDKVIETLQQNAELVKYEVVPGTHHLHLVTPERVAPHINEFLLQA